MMNNSTDPWIQDDERVVDPDNKTYRALAFVCSILGKVITGLAVLLAVLFKTWASMPDDEEEDDDSFKGHSDIYCYPSEEGQSFGKTLIE